MDDVVQLYTCYNQWFQPLHMYICIFISDLDMKSNYFLCCSCVLFFFCVYILPIVLRMTIMTIIIYQYIPIVPPCLLVKSHKLLIVSNCFHLYYICSTLVIAPISTTYLWMTTCIYIYTHYISIYGWYLGNYHGSWLVCIWLHLQVYTLL
jgi:hypothetical protein